MKPLAIRLFLPAIIAIATASMLQPADTIAAMVSHSTAGSLIADGFEGDGVGSFPTGWTVANRVGDPFSTADVDVESGAGAAPTPPSANEGTHFLAVRTNNDAAYQTFGPFTSGTITANFAVYLPSAGLADIGPTFLKSAGVGIGHAAEYVDFENNTWMNLIEGAGTIPGGMGGVNYFNGSAYAPLTVDGVHPFTYSLDAWHTVSMTMDIAAGSSASALSITVDGITLAPLPSNNALASGTVDGFQIYENTNGVGFLDATVPEPASLGLLALGGLALARRRR